MPADIIVRIGAAQDRSIDSVFTDIEKRSKRAFETTRRESGKATSDQQKQNSQLMLSAKQVASMQLKIERDMYREKSRLNRAIAVEQLRTERATALAQARLNRERTRDRLATISQEEKAERESQARMVKAQQAVQREMNRVQRQAARERYREEYKQAREIDRFATRTSHRATRFFFPRPEGALGYSKRVAGDLMRGAGIDMSLSGGVARARERETAGMGLAQQERIATGKSQGGAFWAGKSLEVGAALKTDPEQVTEMMRAFTGKTGDFEAAAKHAQDLAAMTLASGANMGEMGSAAGFVYNQLKGMPDAAERTLDVMRGIVGQTAVGAVEMEEYASQMGRIAANAKMFQGDVSKNILELSALTQLSIAEGGATSGADAARSIAAFANTTSKGQRINAFKKHGVNLFNEEGTQKRPILDIIKDSLIASKGNIPAMTQMWADTLGQKPIRGLTNAFNEAGGGEKGWQAALEKIKPFMSAQLTKETEKANLEDYNKTTAARAAEFQNKLDVITTSMANRLLPALEQLAPKALELANTFSDAVAWAAGNPWQAVMVLLGASVARAATESFGRLILERGIHGLLGGAVGGGGGATGVGSGVAGLLSSGGASVGGALSGGMGVVANSMGALALGAATFMITTAVLNSASTVVNEAKERQAKSGNGIFFDFQEEYGNAKTDEERAAAVKRAKTNLEQDEGSRGFVYRLFGNSDIYRNTLAAIDSSARDMDARRQFASDKATLDNARGSQVDANGKQVSVTDITAVVARELTGQLSKTLQVRVTNTEDFKLFSEMGAPSLGGPPTVAQ